jgi:hypothetical protein
MIYNIDSVQFIVRRASWVKLSQVALDLKDKFDERQMRLD